MPVCHTVFRYSFLITKVIPRLKIFIQVKSAILKNKVHTANLNLPKTKSSFFALYHRNSECINVYTRLKIVKFYVLVAKNEYMQNEAPKNKVTNTLMPNTLLQLGCIHENGWQMLHIRLLFRHHVVSLIGTNNVM